MFIMTYTNNVKYNCSRKYIAQAILFLLHSFTTKRFDINLFKVYKWKKHV